MKLVSLNLRHFALILLLAWIAVAGFGCSTEEPDNASSKPWNSPEGWQNGSLPKHVDSAALSVRLIRGDDVCGFRIERQPHSFTLIANDS